MIRKRQQGSLWHRVRCACHRPPPRRFVQTFPISSCGICVRSVDPATAVAMRMHAQHQPFSLLSEVWGGHLSPFEYLNLRVNAVFAPRPAALCGQPALAYPFSGCRIGSQFIGVLGNRVCQRRRRPAQDALPLLRQPVVRWRAYNSLMETNLSSIARFGQTPSFVRRKPFGPDGFQPTPRRSIRFALLGLLRRSSDKRHPAARDHGWSHDRERSVSLRSQNLVLYSMSDGGVPAA